MRYFFHVTADGYLYSDEDGAEFSSDEEAKAYAAITVGELTQDGFQQTWVLIVDKSGAEIGRVPTERGWPIH